jgi:hypothetical protein
VKSSPKLNKNDVDFAEIQHKENNAYRRHDIFCKVIGTIERVLKLIIALGFFVISIKTVIPHPVENIDAMGDNITKILTAFFDQINKGNWTLYLVSVVLLILIVLLYYRNRSLTKKLGVYRKNEEEKDVYRSSSKLDEYGEKRLGEKK